MSIKEERPHRRSVHKGELLYIAVDQWSDTMPFCIASDFIPSTADAGGINLKGIVSAPLVLTWFTVIKILITLLWPGILEIVKIFLGPVCTFLKQNFTLMIKEY